MLAILGENSIDWDDMSKETLALYTPEVMKHLREADPDETVCNRYRIRRACLSGTWRNAGTEEFPSWHNMTVDQCAIRYGEAYHSSDEDEKKDSFITTRAGGKHKRKKRTRSLSSSASSSSVASDRSTHARLLVKNVKNKKSKSNRRKRRRAANT